MNKYDNHTVSHTFVCSAPECPLVVDIRISPPRLTKSYLNLLMDKAKLYSRSTKAVNENPERYKNHNIIEATPFDALKILRKYLTDIFSNPGNSKKIAVQNKTFVMLFGTDCDALFQWLEFVPYSEWNADAETNDTFWKLPVLQSIDVDAPLEVKSQKDFLQDVITEVIQHMVNSKPEDVALGFVWTPLPAYNDQKKVLGCMDYPTHKRPIELESDTHPHYLGLGANRDFSDQLVLFAYHRQRYCDPKNSPYYLECLIGISGGRDSSDLEIEFVSARSKDENTLSEIEGAYKFLDIPLDTPLDTPNGDDWILGVYKSRIESAPRQKEEARNSLLIIGRARDSVKILDFANNKEMTYEEALKFLELPSGDVTLEWVEAMAGTKVSRIVFPFLSCCIEKACLDGQNEPAFWVASLLPALESMLL
jgi:ubiquitin carboxyl-terminal hydrolase 25/28